MRAVAAALALVLTSWAAAAESDYANWPALKRADAAASRDYYAYYRDRGLLNESDMAQMRSLLLEEIPATLQAAEDSEKARAAELLGAIDAKNVFDQIDDATTADLKDRTSRLLQARLYYFYANMWQRIMLEGFEGAGLPAGPRAVLGSKVDIILSDQEYRAFRDKMNFDPRSYSLPDAFFRFRTEAPRP